MQAIENRSHSVTFGAVLAATAVLAGVTPAAGQVVGMERLVTADGVRLDFASDGVWRRKAARVARTRNQLRGQALFDALNAPAQGAAASAAALTGTLRVPTVLLAFSDTPTPTLPIAIDYDSVFYTVTPLAGRPYTVRTLYEEISNGLFSVTGQAYGWVSLTDNSSFYLDACGAFNPLDCGTGRTRFANGFREALAALDGVIDFSQYDNDGSDNAPNTLDDDGVVDVVQFVQPVLGGECGGPGMWAHKFNLGDLGGVYATNDASAGGGFVTVNSYLVVSGVGGIDCGNPGDIMAIGVSSHELGHGIGLPDLYDTFGASAGIGEWGLMGSGMYTSLPSPTHYSAWSKEQMGWVTVRDITTSGAYTLGPVVSGDTVFAIRPLGGNPGGEYFLLENKQAVLADTANLLTGGSRGPKNGGLLVWHIDSVQVDQGSPGNTVNTGAVHGVALIEADGDGSLGTTGNRGDAGDAYPGSTGNTKLAFSSSPAALKNSDGSFAGFQIDSIEQTVPNGEMRIVVSFGNPAVVRASDSLAVVTVDGVPYNRFANVMEPGRNYGISMADVQVTGDGRREFTFQSWSDGGARTHTIVDPPAGDSIIAQVATRYRVLVSKTGQGSVSATSGAPVESGALVDDGSSVTLVAAADVGMALDGWSGDTTATGDSLTVLVDRPFDVTATFYPVIAFLDSTLSPAIMGAAYSAQLRVGGGAGSGTYGSSVVAGTLPAGLAFQAITDGGQFVGVPEETGVFDLSIGVTSGNLSTTMDLQLQVNAPPLGVDRLVDQLIDGGQLLTADEVRYLDLLGNRNDGFDLGDFLAWLDAGNGAPPEPLQESAPRVLPGGRE
jgi:M6 family metalloprotease-like protein